MAKIPAALARAAALHLTGKREEALAEIEGAIAAGDSHEGLIRAKEQLSQELTAADNPQPALAAEVETAFAESRYEDAATHCAKLAEAAPERPEPWFNLAIASEKTGRIDEAADAYRQAARRDPKLAAPLVNLGALLQKHSEFEEARACYQRALKIEPDHAGALYNLAMMLEPKNPKEAEALLSQSLAQAPESEQAWFRLGLLQLRRGDARPRMHSGSVWTAAGHGPRRKSIWGSRTGTPAT
jgi:Flp pilus assembly protein TadD